MIDNHYRSEYVRLGYDLDWSFTPLRGKAAYLKGWQIRPRESLEQALAWATNGNVGLRTGSTSGIVVIDEDAGGDVSPLELPETVTVNTGGGGRHFYFTTDRAAPNSAGRLGEHIDVRGDGGYVVFPGSMHPSGRMYTWAADHGPWEIELAALPAHIHDKLNGPRPSRPRQGANAPEAPHHTPAGDRYAQAAVQKEIEAVCMAAQGNRNDTLNTAAFNLGQLVGGGCLAESEITELLAAAATTVGLGEREAAATIRSGLRAGKAHPRSVPQRAASEPPPAKPQAGPAEQARGADYILTPGAHTDAEGRYMERSNVQFAEEVLARLPEDAIYRKDFIAGEILGEPGKRKWLELTPDRMRLIVDGQMSLCKWVKKKDGDAARVYQPCARDAAYVVLAATRQSEKIRELTLMVPYPIYGPGFERVLPGWHNGVFFDEPEDLRGLEPLTDCEAIHNILHDLVVDFPFASPADRQNFFGLLLTPIIAPALNGNRPMHLIDASIERTGKSKLAEEVFGGVIIGKQTPALQITERDEERDKRIIGLLLQGETLVHLDNLPPHIDSATLASLLTATTYSGRILGSSRMVNLQNNLTIVGTGNRIQATGEIAKRVVPIILEPGMPDPERRRNFHHPDLRSHVQKNRRMVLSCLLGLVENWLAGGRRCHSDRMGGFESWSETVGGILQVNGLKDWRTNERQWRESSDPGGQELRAFVETWWDTFGDAPVMAADLEMMADNNSLLTEVLKVGSKRGRETALAIFLRSHISRPVKHWKIRVRQARKTTYWLEQTSGLIDSQGN